jgi:hypothetical protein
MRLAGHELLQALLERLAADRRQRRRPNRRLRLIPAPQATSSGYSWRSK